MVYMLHCFKMSRGKYCCCKPRQYILAIHNNYATRGGIRHTHSCYNDDHLALSIYTCIMDMVKQETSLVCLCRWIWRKTHPRKKTTTSHIWPYLPAAVKHCIESSLPFLVLPRAHAQTHVPHAAGRAHAEPALRCAAHRSPWQCPRLLPAITARLPSPLDVCAAEDTCLGRSPHRIPPRR